MTETLTGVSPSKSENLPEKPSLADAAVTGVSIAEPVATEVVDPAEPSEEELAIARELVRSARGRGVAMTGPGGMLKALTTTVIETRSMRRSPTTWAMRGTIRPVVGAATPATAPDPRRC